ncbi:MFS transporter [Massilia sp. WF1]|uniref:MFS transporter n=1 Tax=unclassified Massilia TaxID=2609279 RepID=UPI00064AB6E2|nr:MULTISPECIES: MFS transporter [unclassified Massilia]ALK98276.1 MFS transporter [Massilia sp. WG5]KLU37147.1 MFS transporter [Massilia sp. WF1]
MPDRRFSTLRKIPRPIWVLGFVSMLMDISSEIVHSLLPMFLVSGLGASVAAVGLIEGIAEAAAPIVKVFSGGLSDYLGKRKWLAVAGYALGAASKPFFAIATSANLVLAARFVDRIGKGIRGAPRDALVADIAPPESRGAAFGLRQSLDTLGAFTGPLIAVALMFLWANDYRRIFWIAVIPGACAVLLLALGVKEPRHASASRGINPIRRESLRKLSADYWWVVAIGAVFALARFSEAFLVLRAMEGGMRPALVPLVMVAMNLVYTLSAYPFGKLADAISHPRLLVIGLGFLVLADLVLAQGNGWPVVLLGVSLWGLHMGMTEGLLAVMVANTAPPELKGTAFGFFNLVSGIAMLLASPLAGLLWEGHGAAATFHAGAAFSMLAAMLIVGLGRRQA